MDSKADQELYNDSSNQSSENKPTDTQLKEQLAACKVELDAWKEKFLQINADLQNLQRRTAKEQANWVHTLQSKMLNELLLIVDDFDRAFSTTQSTDQLKGFELIRQAMHKFLKNQGVQELPSATTFDPHYHEALMTVADKSVPSGTIMQVLRKGYLLNGSLLRTAQVSVAE